ncbi:MAG: glutamate synthase large subunit, partial [Planctomycetota bacterium]
NSLNSRTVLYKGMLLSEQLDEYYPDLSDHRVTSAVALVHQRYSTNTFPTWELAQPFRYLCHNGEINTLRGNINRMRARQAVFAHSELEHNVTDLSPVIFDEGASDTACLDNCLELLVATGYDLDHALAMMIPEAYVNNEEIPQPVQDFYRYHACLMEQWDGPACIAGFDGRQVVATLDRNGLRPARFWVTVERNVVFASEAGVLDIDPARIVRKGRLGPGMMLKIDLERGAFEENDVIKHRLAEAQPYGRYIDEHMLHWNDLPTAAAPAIANDAELLQRQQVFGYTTEDKKFIIGPMCVQGAEPIHSMGADTPHAVLSKRTKLLYWYFKQCFAQVTNPAIDPIREELVMSLRMYLGSARNLLQPVPRACHMLEVDNPILSNEEVAVLIKADVDGVRGCQLDITYPAGSGTTGLEARLEELFAEAEAQVDAGRNILVLGDRTIAPDRAPIPALLATSAIHQHLIRAGKRTQCSLVVQSGEPREVHHYALLFGYGAVAINPYMAFETIQEMVTSGQIALIAGNDEHDRDEDAVQFYTKNYIKAVHKGLKKILSKMGNSTLQSYAAAQIFEAVGIATPVIERHFPGTRSQIEGVGLGEIERETAMRHEFAFAAKPDPFNNGLEQAGEYHWRPQGEDHLINPEMIALVQQAVRTNDPERYAEFSRRVNDRTRELCTLRGLFEIKPGQAIPIEEVEPAESIMRRFATGAMSLGSISPEAHQTLAQAMNAIGGKSNTGEGGEDPARFEDDRCSHIKQVASGRFGVTPHYLVNAKELQIKICQGAKPGEGGHLPGHKVTEYIAWLRYSVPQVTLISPPPHHDIYSIEDLAQLIFDLKNVNPAADISVKLVSLSGVGTVAAGVSKGHADTVIIAGFDGGTGASPASSIKHAGMPWEVGLAETHQTLALNDLRGRIRVQTDGKMATGRDVIIATCLGAEEYGFSTLPLITIGCIMMRKCHLGTCPVGVATQIQGLREKFRGKPEHVINYFHFVAEEVRSHLAQIGVRSLDELVGRTEFLEMNKALAHWKSKGLDYTRLLATPKLDPSIKTHKCQDQDHGLDKVLDRELIELCAPALERHEQVVIEKPIFNYNRTACTMLSGEVAKRHGREGLPDGTIDITFSGVAGQSFGVFLAPGINLTLLGEANDYCGKGMNGGRLVVRPDPQASFTWHENSVVGNTVLYGATGGKAFFAGRAGERFCVRNSGAHTVVEGIGDHGCEYMTGGRMICLGPTGRNFAAGMSGGIAYVLDEEGRFGRRCNKGMVDLDELADPAEIAEVRALIEEHHAFTGSSLAQRVLEQWDALLPQFIKIFPHEYRRVLMEAEAKRQASNAASDKEVAHG